MSSGVSELYEAVSQNSKYRRLHFDQPQSRTPRRMVDRLGWWWVGGICCMPGSRKEGRKRALKKRKRERLRGRKLETQTAVSFHLERPTCWVQGRRKELWTGAGRTPIFSNGGPSAGQVGWEEVVGRGRFGGSLALPEQCDWLRMAGVEIRTCHPVAQSPGWWRRLSRGYMITRRVRLAEGGTSPGGAGSTWSSRYFSRYEPSMEEQEAGAALPVGAGTSVKSQDGPV